MFDLLEKLGRLQRHEIVHVLSTLQDKLLAMDKSNEDLLKASILRALRKTTGQVKVSFHGVSKKEMSRAWLAIENVIDFHELSLDKKGIIVLTDLLCEESIRHIRFRGQYETASNVVRQLYRASDLVSHAFPGYGKVALTMAINKRLGRKRRRVWKKRSSRSNS